MWLFTKIGFFSIVEHNDKGASSKGELVVRARVREDLDNFRKLYAPKLGATVELPGRDYPYRGYIERETLSEAMVRVVMDLDYSNFKDEVAHTQGYDRAHLYGGVWGILLNAEAKLGARVKKAGEKERQKKLF